jgi:hypothetical protein
MKLQSAKTGLWLVTLAMCGTSVAAAQISAAQASSPIAANFDKQDAPSALSSGNPSASESGTVLTASSSLPDAPSAISELQAAQEPSQPSPPSRRSPAAPAKPPLDTAFWLANGALLGSTIANAEFIAECRPSACQLVPDAIRSRPALYGIGIPASLGITYISYRLRRSGTRWWIAPVALFTAGNIVYAWHASQFSH